MAERIGKLDGARRQIDTAIDLFFGGADSLSIHTLAFAAFKVLFDLYPHRLDDGFDRRLDDLLTKEHWRSMSGVANFLKHADKDPDAFLESHHAAQAMAIIGLATLMFSRLSGAFSLKMRAFDYWFDSLHSEQLGITDEDTDTARVEWFRQKRASIKALPFDDQVKVGREAYTFFLEHHEEIEKKVSEAIAQGENITQILNRELGSLLK